MPAYANRVWMSTATTGTGTITLGTAQTGYITFAQGGIADASSVTYTIIDGNNFEVGRGTYTSSGTTLSRDTVLVSLISGTTKLTLSGTATVFLTQVAEDVAPSGANTNITSLNLGAGSVSAPSLSTTGDTNTGMFFPAADTIAFAEGGVEALRINSSAQVVFQAGTSSLPSITASGDLNAGIFFPAADTIGFATSGAEEFRIGPAGQFGIAGANYGTSGQFIKSAGSAASPSWASIANTDISGLGTMSTQNANSVAITGGSITGITDLTVADGGTGASSFTAYSVVLGGTTSAGALQNVSGVGTAGQVLTSAGAGVIPTWATIGGYTLLDTQTFNSSGTWTKTGITGSPKFCVVWLWGGGGGGGRGDSNAPGGGGGGGSCNVFVFPYSQLAATQSVTVGNGGNGRTSGSTAGGTGGNTTFATFAIAYGGGGGGYNNGGGGGGGGSGTAGQGADVANSLTGGAGGSNGNPNQSDPTEIYGWYGFSVDTAVVDTSGALTTTDYIPIKTSRTYWMSRTSSGATGGTGSAVANTVGGSTTVATTPFGGGGGAGGQDSASAWTFNSSGGAAYYGGGGGGAGSSVAPSSGTQAGGVSTFGGNGGAGTTGATAATAGSQPGGGGGGTETGNSGAGGAGRVIVYTYG